MHLLSGNRCPPEKLENRKKYACKCLENSKEYVLHVHLFPTKFHRGFAMLILVEKYLQFSFMIPFSFLKVAEIPLLSTPI